MRVVLASASPRRRELLKAVVRGFDVLSPDADERLTLKRPSAQVMRLARLKADAVKARAGAGAAIIAADTLVWRAGEYFGKPKDAADAVNTLLKLSGKSHWVYTGVCVEKDGEIKVFYDKAAVRLKRLSREFIDGYVDGGSPLDKAGAYGIQDGVAESFEGDYTTIVGLPCAKLREALIEIGGIL